MGMKRDEGDDRAVYRSLAMILQFGLNMVVPIGLMSALGIWLDRRFGTSFWVIVLFAAGAVAGAQNIYRMAKGICGEEERRKGRDVSGEEDEDNRKA